MVDDCIAMNEDACSPDEEIGSKEIDDNLIRDDDPSTESTDDGPNGLNRALEL